MRLGWLTLYCLACSSSGDSNGSTEGEDDQTVDGLPVGDDDDDNVGDDDDDDDTLSSTGDRCTGPDPTEPVALRFGEMDNIVVDEMQAIYHVPEDPRAILFFFHGSGGDAGEVNYLEQWKVYNRAHCNGIAVMAGSAIRKEWNRNTPASDNPDVARLVAMRDAVEAAESMPADLPVLVMGFSDGGGFTPLFAELMANEGWDVRALSVHNSGGQLDPSLPTIWSLSEHDEPQINASIRSRHATMEGAGYDTQLLEWNEAPMVRDHLTVIENYDQTLAEGLFDELVDLDIVDAGGVRTFDIATFEDVLDEYKETSEGRSPAKVSRQLRVVWATHRFSGAYADTEMDFLLSYL